MFRRLDGIPGRKVEIFVEDVAVQATEGDNLAAQLLVLGFLPFRRSEVDGGPRAPHCMIGACFECLVEADGRPNQQACMCRVRAGMRVRRQRRTEERDQ